MCGCNGGAAVPVMSPEQLQAQQAERQRQAQEAREAYAASMRNAMANASTTTSS